MKNLKKLEVYNLLENLVDDILLIKKDIENNFFIYNNKKYFKKSYQMSQINIIDIINKLEDYKDIINNNIIKLNKLD